MSLEWSDERTDRAKAMWLQGISASQIANQLGGVSRCAVIGKMHRLGFERGVQAKRETTAQTNALRAKIKREPAPKAKTEPTPPARPPLPDLPGTATVLTLGAHMCKWPIGDPSGADFSFCGRRTRAEGTYCVAHARVAYEPSKPRKPATEPRRRYASCAF